MQVKWALHSYIYTLHMDVSENWATIAQDAQAGGFQGVQVFLYDLSSDAVAADMAEVFDAHDLQMIGASVNTASWDPAATDEIFERLDVGTERLASMNASILTLNSHPQPDREKTDADYDVQAETISRIVSLASSKGLTVAYHPVLYDTLHDCRETRELTARLSASDLRFGPDTGWLVEGGVTVHEFLDDHRDRLDFLHVRDKRDGVWSEYLGDGDIDWAKVGEVLESIDFDGWVCVEPMEPQRGEYTSSLRSRHQQGRTFLSELWDLG